MPEYIRTEGGHGGIEPPVKSWVRYSVAVYVGLLLAGAIDLPKPESAARVSALVLVTGNNTSATNPPSPTTDHHRDTCPYPGDWQDQHLCLWIEV